MAHPIRPCDVCGTPYEPYYWGEKRKTRTCSKPCMAKLNRAEAIAAKAARRAAARAGRTCPRCGNLIDSTRIDKKHCSKKCARDAFYAQADPGYVRIKQARRAGLTPEGAITQRDWLRLRRRHRGGCAYCGSLDQPTMDHIIPLSRGGRHTVGNVLPACLPCNVSKHNRLLAEWRMHRGTEREWLI